MLVGMAQIDGRLKVASKCRSVFYELLMVIAMLMGLLQPGFSPSAHALETDQCRSLF